jgi:hypothetical protein
MTAPNMTDSADALVEIVCSATTRIQTRPKVKIALAGLKHFRKSCPKASVANDAMARANAM